MTNRCQYVFPNEAQQCQAQAVAGERCAFHADMPSGHPDGVQLSGSEKVAILTATAILATVIAGGLAIVLLVMWRVIEWLWP